MQLNKVMAAMVLIPILFILFASMFGLYTNTWVGPYEVTHKERIISDGDSYYLVFTEEEVFTVRDSFAKFRFNSSDLYGRIAKDESYKFKVYWVRIPILSWYRNILDIELQH